MSFDLRNIREISNEPQAKFINQLAKKLAKFLNKNQTDKLESKEDLYSAGQDIDTVVKLHSFESTNTFDFLTAYYPPLEPDGDKLKIWVRGTNLGNTLKDWAKYGRTISLHGDAMLLDGTPFDSGIHTGGTKSIALRFNRPTSENENDEYIRIVDSSDIRVNGITTGVSYFIRFRVFAFDTQGSFTRTLIAKYDDASNGVLIQITSDGRLKFIIKRAGTEYRVQTDAGELATNIVYDAWCTYANSGNVSHIYINNVDKSLTDPGSPTWPTLTPDMFIMTREIDDGHIYGDLYDARMYREKVVSSTEVGYFNTNKWTIANVPYGAVMLSDYWATGYTIGQGYTTTGYTTAGYDT
jgi:hypothetical protein